MKARDDLRSMVATLLLVAAVVVALVGIGCFGGGDEGSDDTSTTGGADTSVAQGGTTVASMDPLSSFKSKDPFIPQAQLTTSTAPPVVTTRSTVTTIRVTTTTAPHRLTVTAFPGDGTVSFTLDGITLTGFGAGPALFNGGWGSIQILAVNDTLAPFSATFRRNGSIDFTLQVNATRTW